MSEVRVAVVEAPIRRRTEKLRMKDSRKPNRGHRKGKNNGGGGPAVDVF